MSNHDNPHKQRARRRRSLHYAPALVGTVLLSAALSILALAGSVAYAGEWMQVSCVNPNQSAAPSAGWSSFAGGGGYGSDNSTSCGPGSPAFAILSTDAAVAVGSNETLQYTPPAGSTLAGGSVDVSFYADGRGYDASGTAVAYTPEYAYNGSNVFFQCASGLPACANSTYDFSGVLALPANRGGNLYLSAGCGGGSGYSCNEGGSDGAWSLVQLSWANLLLSNDSTPTAAGITGTLLDPGARGSEELTFTASDPQGPGVYAVTAQVDGQTLYSGTPNNNGGKCSPVGESDGALMFDASQPCPASESVDLPINTTSLTDGPHTLKVTVEDAATNTSVVYDGTITTHNAPKSTTTPTISTPAPLTVASTLSAHPGEWSAPSGAGTIAYAYQWEDCDTQGQSCQAIPGAENQTYTPAPNDTGHRLRVTVIAANSDGAASAASTATGIVLADESPLSTTPNPGTPTTTTPPTSMSGSGTPNGTPASETATLHLNGPATITRSYAHRAFTLAGRLTNSQSQPIADATLDVLQQIAGTTTLTLNAHATTSPTGTFTLTVPAGPSRSIEVAYRALSNDPSYAATASVRETVQASAHLKITPGSTSPTGTIILTGRVQGPIPPQGTIVELLVHYLGHWEPFRDPRTNGNGSFHVDYQFQGAIGRFPFRIEIPAGQADFPYISGYSNIVDAFTG
jgi:hypothetical protein